MLTTLVFAAALFVSPELRWDAPKPVIEAPQLVRVSVLYAVMVPRHLALRDMPNALTISYALMGLAGMPATSWWALRVERQGPDVEIRWPPDRYRYALTLDREVHVDELWWPRNLMREQQKILLLHQPFGRQFALLLGDE